ncbi:MAG: efflux RND transporter periplasmic adaptor subunit [Acidobacteriaceae bacterium]
MTSKSLRMTAVWLTASVSLAACVSLVACKKKFNPADGAVPQGQVIGASNTGLVTVERPERFSLVAADRMEARAQLNVTGTVNPDIAREVPAISLASGRIVSIKARLDDNVKKGQLLLQVQSTDATNAFDAYLKAVNDEQLTNKTYVRTKDLYAHGAVPLSQLEQAEDAEKDAKADLVAAEEQLKTLGVDKNHPSSIVNVYAPITGVIVAQNVTNAAAAGVTYSGTSTLFTIADLSVVWVICDVYENDIPKVHLGQLATIHIDAYPGKVLVGHISDIGPVLDPNLRTAKVRIEVPNPGILRLGMFVNAVLESRTDQVYAVVPASAILHLHDRDWVFVPAGGKQFQRVEVNTGDMLPGNKQQIFSGIAPGQQVVADVLQLEETLEAQ